MDKVAKKVLAPKAVAYLEDNILTKLFGLKNEKLIPKINAKILIFSMAQILYPYLEERLFQWEHLSAKNN